MKQERPASGSMWVPYEVVTEVQHSYACLIYNLLSKVEEPAVAVEAIRQMLHGWDNIVHDFEQVARRVPEVSRGIPAGLRESVLERDGEACLKCGSIHDLHMDHIIPWSQGGATDFDNLQTLCAPCNSAKRTDAVDYRVEASA